MGKYDKNFNREMYGMYDFNVSYERSRVPGWLKGWPDLVLGFIAFSPAIALAGWSLYLLAVWLL